MIIRNRFHFINLSFNQPTLCANATWNPDATTFTDRQMVGSNPWTLFVSVNNSVYVIVYTRNRIEIWLEESEIPARDIYDHLKLPMGLFVTRNGDIYVSVSGIEKKNIKKSSLSLG
jgi:hypothetical protein